MSPNRPSISILVTSYKRPKLLLEALQSISHQTFKDFEVLVTDDFPMPEIEQIVASFKGSMEIRYIKNEVRLGAVLARNVASGMAKGQYLAFLDDDDCWEPTYLETLWGIIQSQSPRYIASSYQIREDNVRLLGTKCVPEKFDVRDYLTRNPGVLCSNVLIEKKLFDELGGFDTHIQGSADKDLFLRVALGGHPHAVSTAPLVRWRLHSSQWSSTHHKNLQSALSFYRKYFTHYDLKTHLKLHKKILWLTKCTVKEGFSRLLGH